METYAHLEGEQIDARLVCEMKDHPLFLVPRGERQRLLAEQAASPSAKFQLAAGVLEGELCHKCRQIYAALLAVLQRRLPQGAPPRAGGALLPLAPVHDRRGHGGAADVGGRRLPAGHRRPQPRGKLPGALQNLFALRAYGPLVDGNRGVIEFSDLLKRPLEHYKYLLGTVETGIARMDHFLLHLDAVLIASSNEKHLSAFKEMGDFA